MSSPHGIDHIGPEIAALILGLHEEFDAYVEMNGHSPFGGGIGYYETLFNAACVFCLWADDNVDYGKLAEAWPYYCRDTVAPVLCQVTKGIGDHMENFTADHAKTVAERLELPLKNRHG